jgi:hypothetical protein
MVERRQLGLREPELRLIDRAVPGTTKRPARAAFLLGPLLNFTPRQQSNPGMPRRQALNRRRTMQGDEPLDILPLWALLAVVLLIVLLSVECGYRLGKRVGRPDQEQDSPLDEMVGATLGLLAFLLAFTFSLAASRYDTRRQLLLDEANAIGTTYLRAAMLPEGGRDIQSLLRQYVDIRLEAVRTHDLAYNIRRSEDLQARLWARAVPIARRTPDAIVTGLFVQSLNELIDLHAKRLTASVRNRIPLAIWASLYGVTTLSFAVLGYHAGLASMRRSPAIVPVAVTFAVVIWLIADLDRPQEGALTVNQQALIDVRASMDAQQ